MPKRKYTVSVSNAINCSSQMNYHVDVVVKWAGGYNVRLYDITNGGLLYKNGVGYYKGYPRYVMREIASQLKAMHAAGELRVYEYDRDSVARYEGLRYHVPDYLASLIADL